MTLRQPLFVKYAALIMALAGGGLLASGAIEIYFSHRLHRATLAEVQRDKAVAAASSVSRYVEDLAHQIGWATVPACAPSVAAWWPGTAASRSPAGQGGAVGPKRPGSAA